MNKDLKQRSQYIKKQLMMNSQKQVNCQFEKEMNQQIQSQSKILIQLKSIVESISKRIDESQLQWKNMHFANKEDENQIQEDLEQQYIEWLEKYRGKEGEIRSIGLILYYKFLKFIMILFGVLTIVSIPVFVNELRGNGLLQYSSAEFVSVQFLKLSLANQKYYRYDNLSAEEIKEIQFNRNLVIFIDIMCIMIVLISLIWWKVNSHRAIRQYIAKSPAPWMYTLEVSNIPKNISVHRLERHFKYFGKVVQIQPIRSHESNIIRMKYLVNLIHQYKLTAHKYEKKAKIFQNISELYQQLAESYLNKPIPSIQSAFIAFDNIQIRNRTFELYKYNVNLERLLIDNDLPEVKKCNIEPLTINWQNYHLKSEYHTKMNICQFILVVIMLFVIVIALFLLNINSNYLRAAVKKYSSLAPPNLQYLDLSDEQLIYSFCANLTFEKFKWSYYEVCSNYFDNYKNQFMLMVLFSLLVVVINLLTNRILRQLVQFRRYKTIAQKNNFLITAIFFFSLINSGILIIIMRGKNIGPALCWIVTKILNFSQQALTVEIFQEFNRKWYLTIGSQLIFNYIITLIICPNLYILKYWIKSYFQRRKQILIDRKINDPDFDYCTFYAMSLKAIFFSLFYSQSMPILYPLTIASIIVQFLVAKLLMKKFVRQPMFFDSTANETVIRILPYALIIHTFLSIMFINVDQIFPNKSSYSNMNASWLYINLMKFQRGYIHCIILGILLISTFYRDQFYKLIIDYWLPLKQQQNKTFTQIARNPSFLSSYRMKDNPRYKIVAYALQLFEAHMKIIFNRSQSKQIHLFGKSDTPTYNFQIPKSIQSMQIISQDNDQGYIP